MNKSEYLDYLRTIFDRVGEPEIAVDKPEDIARREAIGQKWYKVAVVQIAADTDGNEVSKTTAHHFYVYDEDLPTEKAVSVEKAPCPIIETPEPPNTFQQDAIEWFKVNKDPSIRKFGVNEIAPEIEMIRFRVFALDDTGNMDEWMQIVWKEGDDWFQAKYNGTYKV